MRSHETAEVSGKLTFHGGRCGLKGEIGGEREREGGMIKKKKTRREDED